MKLSENALEVLNKRYLMKDDNGVVIETPIGLIERVAKYVSEAERSKELQEHWYQKFRELLLNLYFLPNSPTLRNAGANKGSLSACFYLDIQDSRKSIFTVLKQAVEIQAFGGGTGHNFSYLRPEGSLIFTTKGKSSGPVIFMKVFNFVVGEVIQQGGCFVESTLVATAEGPKPIRDLKQGDLVYSWNGRFILAKCTNSWLTKKNAEVWKLSTDKGLVVYATPDHPFLVRYSNGKNKKYIQLKDLKIGTPLMPLTRYKKGNEWFITLHDGKDTRMTEHQWMAEFLNIKGHIHHKDEKHDNNVYSNFEGMSPSEHSTHHGKKRYEEGTHPFLFLTEDQKRKAVNSRKEWFSNLSEKERLEYCESVSKGVEGINQQRIENGTHNFVTNPPMRNEISKIKKLKNCIANSMWKVMEKGLSVNIKDWEENAKKAGLYNTQRFSVSKIEEIFGSFDSALEYLDNRNQRVLSIEFSHYEDVWNVEVPGSHNFVVCDENRKGVVVSNTRHGAQMGLLDIDHPDIEKFISCKQTEGDLNNFNISITMSDDFMNHLDILNNKNDNSEFNWPLKFGNKVVEEINGLSLWNKIIIGAWRNGEPGLLFIDTVNRLSPTYPYQIMRGCNPCWSGDTKVWTIYGPKSFRELAENKKDIPVLSQTKDRKLVFRYMRKPRMTVKKTKLIKLTLNDGTELKLTPTHNLYIYDKNITHRHDDRIKSTKLIKREAKDLCYGDSLASVYRIKANQKGYLRLTNGIDKPLEHHVVVDFKYGRRPNYPYEHSHHIDKNKDNNIPENLELLSSKVHNGMKMLGESNPMSSVWDKRNPLFNKKIDGKNNPRYRHDIKDEDLWNLRQQGKTIAELATIFNCCKYTISKRLKEMELVNHVVVSVEWCTELEDVYNGTVDETNSYFVMCGDSSDAILSANCGEQILGNMESCNLGSINLSKFVYDDCSDGFEFPNPTIDWKHLKEVVRTAVRFLDNVIDVNNYPIPEIEIETKKFRKIGLGVMGWADMLLKLKISYNSPGALELAEKVMKFINDEAVKYSEELAKEKGFGTWEGYCDENLKDSDKDNPLFKRRNATLTTIAPTGTLSLIANCSSGIEPVFSFEFTKKCIDKEIIVKHPLYKEWCKNHLKEMAEDWENKIGGLLPLLPIKHTIPHYFVESKDIPIEQHVRMQAAFQKHVHNAVSKTINAPNSATIEDVDRAFRLAYKLNCKGLTFYRNGSREVQAQTAVRGEPKLATMIDQPSGFDHSQDAIKNLTIPEAKKLAEDILIKAESERLPVLSPDQDTPTWLPGWREKVKTGSGTLWVHIFVDPDTGFREVWTAVSKPGRDMAAAADSTGRLITLALKHGASWDEIVKQLQGHIGEKTVWDNGVQIMSIQDGTAKVIRKRCVDNELPDFVCPFNKKCQSSSTVEQALCKDEVAGSIPVSGSIPVMIEKATKAGFITDKSLIGKALKNLNLCPDCASILIHDEGCKGGRCRECGWSNCS